MGARLRYVVVALVLPPGYSLADARGVMAGLTGDAKRSDAALVGGNVSRGESVAITVTAIGEAGGRIATRGGAEPGDAIYVTGTLGSAAAGVELLERSRGSGSGRLVDAYRTPPLRLDAVVRFDHLEEDHIYVLNYGQDEGSGTWQRYVDTFREGDPESAGFTSPEGMQEPIRGFGKVWRNELGSRDAAIGWALAPEQGYVGEAQPFEHGVMLWCPLEGVIYVLLDDGGWTAHTTPR